MRIAAIILLATAVISSFAADPVVAITAPTPGIHRSVVMIAGTASHPDGIVGYGVFIHRLESEDGEAYWNWRSSSWDAPDSFGNPPTFDSWNDFKRTTPGPAWSFPLPPLDRGRYELLACAYDAGEHCGYASVEIRIDNVAPTIAIAQPTASAFPFGAVPEASGSAADTGGSVVDHVTIELLRDAAPGRPAAWWNWTTSSWDEKAWTASNATVAIGTSSWHRALPSLRQGSYTLYACAWDAVGNRGIYAVRPFTVRDLTGPTVTITNLIDGGSYSSVAAVVGTASDTGGSGIDRVELWLHRDATAKTTVGEWDWSTKTWVTSVEGVRYWAPAGGTAFWAKALPTLAAGGYQVGVRAFDRAGNVSTLGFGLEVAFTIDPKAPATAVTSSSPVPGPFRFRLGETLSVAGSMTDGSAQEPMSALVAIGALRRLGANGEIAARWDWRLGQWNRRLPPEQAWAPLSADGSSWSIDLPPQPIGSYELVVYVTDAAGNKSRPAICRFAVTDGSAPNIAIATPEDGDCIVIPASASGNASDQTGPIRRVAIVLAREHEHEANEDPNGHPHLEFWDWAQGGWTRIFDAARHERSASGRTDWSAGLPRLAPGEYHLEAAATDADGNRGLSGWREFMVCEPVNQ